ncbi:MAG: DNA polymerase III subunit gamma/tau [Gemmatimonadaceae bacterium]|nr:DNA polymerase III subunit gamma/tau [Gemmatimonadaceae bacterium]
MSIALARKYRPRNFATVAVQSHVANTLKGAIARGRVAHGYLLCGPRGTGKTTLARVLAMALNCEQLADERHRAAAAKSAGGVTSESSPDSGEPCGRCTSCERIWSGGASMDVVEIDAASNRGVDDARELRERAMYAPSGDDRYKVYIVDEAHMLTREAWNALLKVLEEPPPRVVFVFATTEPQKIAQMAAPVLSRLQRFDLKRIGPSEIRERLAIVLREEGLQFEEEALAMIARAADGGLRDALSLTDQVLSLGETSEVTAERVRVALGLIPDDEYLALLDIVVQRRAADVFPAVQKLADAGVDFTLVLSGLGDLLRAQLAIALGGTPAEMPERLRAALVERAGLVSASDVLRMLHALLEMEPMFRRSGQPQLLLETLLVRFALIDRTVELEEVLKGFGDGGRADPPARRVAVEPRVASAHALPPAPPAAVAPAIVQAPMAPPTPRPATAQVAAAAAAAQQMPAEPTPPRPVRAKSTAAPPELDTVLERWSELSELIKRNGRGAVAQAVQWLRPIEITAQGSVVLGYAANDDHWARAAESARGDIVTALQGCFDGITTFTLRAQKAVGGDGSVGDPTSKRITAHDVKKERLDGMTARDPVLLAAVEVLDLELRD